MRLRRGANREEAEQRVADALAELDLSADDLYEPPPPRSLLSLLFRPRLVKRDEEES